MEDGTSGNPFVIDDDTQERLVLIQQMYQEKQELLRQATQPPVFTLAHLQQYCAALQQQTEKMDTSTGSTSSLTGAGASSSSVGSMPQTPTTSHAPSSSQSNAHATPPNQRHRRLTNDMRSLSGSSQTISQHTKDRLKMMIASKRAGSGSDGSSGGEGSSSGGGGGGRSIGNSRTPPSHSSVAAASPHFEPYPISSHHHRDANIVAQAGEFALRKVNSEPNMKMKIRARLLSKGNSPVHSANSAFNFHPNHIQRHDSEASTSGLSAPSIPPILFPPSLMMPSPSLPNLLPPLAGNNIQNDFANLLSQAAGLNSFLSLPSLLKNQMGLGMTEDQGMDKDKLDPRTAGSSSGSLPIGGYPSLLKQQLRELVLRRKSLVREEPEESGGTDQGGGETSLGSSLLPASFLMNCGAGSSGLGMAPSTSGLSLGSSSSSFTGDGKKTGIAYDSAMAKHECLCGDASFHVEHGGRVQSVWARLTEKGLVARCEKIPSRKASLELLKSVHPQTYVTFFAVSPTACIKMEASQLPVKSFVQLSCGGIGVDSDTYYNDASTQIAARLAVGNLVDLCNAVVDGKVRNGFACIRPPGHHAEREQAMGFCFFNNVSIAVRALQQKYPVECAKIAIIDWDVHHGNGTQPVFEDDPNVLYLSIHRHDHGSFFPGTGAVTEVGTGEGKGYTVNVAMCGGSMGDADYLAAWRVIVTPILDSFRPDFILVSAGFDACSGHPNTLGGYEVSPAMFGYMTRSLMNYAGGKVVLALEGGYNLESIADAAEECVRVLTSQGEEAGVLSDAALSALPSIGAQESIQKVMAIHKSYWPVLAGGIQPINISEQQWQIISRQFKNMSVCDTAP